MRKKIRNIIKKIAPGSYSFFHITQRLVYHKNSFLYQSGWDKSIKERKPLDSNGNIIPWANYAFVTFLNEKLVPSLKIFEYGSGFSTYYFNSKGNEVCSAEHHKDWIVKVKEMLSNKTMIVETDGNDMAEYSNCISIPNRKFDIIFIDGLHRNSCAVTSINFMTESGVIILDDSERKEYQKTFELMKQEGFKSLTFTSIKPLAFKLASTTVFYKKNNCLDI